MKTNFQLRRLSTDYNVITTVKPGFDEIDI